MTKSPQFIRLTRLVQERSRSSTDFNATAFVLTQALCEWFHCEWGTFWHVNSERTALNSVINWHEPSLRADKLLLDTKGKCLRLDEGNAGLVWRTGKPKCTSDLVMDMCLPRSLEAREAGLIGGIWIPVWQNKTIVGVIEMLGTHYWTNNKEFLYQLEQLGVALGAALKK